MEETYIGSNACKLGSLDVMGFHGKSVALWCIYSKIAMYTIEKIDNGLPVVEPGVFSFAGGRGVFWVEKASKIQIFSGGGTIPYIIYEK